MKRLCYGIFSGLLLIVLLGISYLPYQDDVWNSAYDRQEMLEDSVGLILHEDGYCSTSTDDPQIILRNLPPKIHTLTIDMAYGTGFENYVGQGQIFWASDTNGFNEGDSALVELKSGSNTIFLDDLRTTVLRIDPVNEAGVVFDVKQITVNDKTLLENQVMGWNDLLVCLLLILSVFIVIKSPKTAAVVAIAFVLAYFYSGFVYQYRLDLQFVLLFVGLLASYSILLGFIYFWRNEM